MLPPSKNIAAVTPALPRSCSARQATYLSTTLVAESLPTSRPANQRNGALVFCTSPERFLELTDVPGIKPARYMARFRWVTIVDVGTIPAEYLQELITWSYTKALSGLSKRQQSAIAGERPNNSFKPKPLRGSA